VININYCRVLEAKGNAPHHEGIVIDQWRNTMEKTIEEVRLYFMEAVSQATGHHLSGEEVGPLVVKLRALCNQIIADNNNVCEDIWDLPGETLLSDMAREMFGELRCTRERLFQRFVMAG